MHTTALLCRAPCASALQALLVCALAGAASNASRAEPSLLVYGRIDLSIAQQADTVGKKELRNGSASRLGFRAVEELGDGLKAFAAIEHRFAADDGTSATSRFWEGKSIVGIEDRWGSVTLGRDENPAYTHGQIPADPWGGDTVASNTAIVSGRIGSTRYSDSVTYRLAAGAYALGVQVAEAASNMPSAGRPDGRPYSLGMAWRQGPWQVGLGHENPAGRDDRWTTVAIRHDLGFARVGGLLGSGRNALGEKHRAQLAFAAMRLAGGELRVSWGRLENRAPRNATLDRQLAVGWHRPLSKRTTLYADLVRESRDGLPDDRRRTGWDAGMKHSF